MRGFLSIFVVALLAGCSVQQAGIGAGQYEPTTPTLERQQVFFLGGVGQTKQIDAASVCGGADRVARVEARQSGLDVLIGTLTLGFVTPRTARVYCVR